MVINTAREPRQDQYRGAPACPEPQRGRRQDLGDSMTYSYDGLNPRFASGYPIRMPGSFNLPLSERRKQNSNNS